MSKKLKMLKELICICSRKGSQNLVVPSLKEFMKEWISEEHLIFAIFLNHPTKSIVKHYGKINSSCE